MMQQSVNAYSKPPMTPSLKRAAPSTPSNRDSKKRRIATPTPTPISTPRRQQQRKPVSLLTPRRNNTPRVAVGTPDRFIQGNRTGTDIAKARRALLSRGEEQRGKPSEYHGKLHQSLFGTPVKEGRLLSFSTTKKDKKNREAESRIGRFESPFLHDTLRVSKAVTPAQTSQSVGKRRKAVIQPSFRVSANNMLQFEGLKLVSCGPKLAVALHSELYLFQAGKSAEFFMEHDDIITCVQWSPSRKWLAIGCVDCVQVWCPRRKQLVAEFCYHPDKGRVTAIAWRGELNLAAANSSGVMLFDCSQMNPVPICSYQGDGSYPNRLVWTENILASALPESGAIYIYDKNQREAVRTIEHPGILDLKVHPSWPSVLISCGNEGIRFWEASSGKLLNSFQTESAVSGFVWSPFRSDEMAVAENDRLSLWKFHRNGKVGVKVEEMTSENGQIMSLEPYGDGRVVCTHKEKILAGFEIFRGAPSTKRQLTFGVAIR